MLMACPRKGTAQESTAAAEWALAEELDLALAGELVIGWDLALAEEMDLELGQCRLMKCLQSMKSEQSDLMYRKWNPPHETELCQTSMWSCLLQCCS
jgi:hypothetical protein